MKKRLLLLLTIALLSGCSSLQERYTDAPFIADKYVYHYQPENDQYNLILFRARGLTADICNLAIYINQQHTTVLQSEQKVKLLVPEGKITIQISFEGNKYCSNRGVDDKTIIIEPQMVTTMTLSVFGNGGVKFDQHTSQDAF